MYGEDVVLTTLRLARARISEVPLGYGNADADVWDFSIWTTCTCGHIYTAAVANDTDGSMGPGVGAGSPGGLYEQVLAAVREATKAEADEVACVEDVAIYVNNLTSSIAHRIRRNAKRKIQSRQEGGPTWPHRPGETLREAALQIIDTTIAHIEAKHEAALLKA